MFLGGIGKGGDATPGLLGCSVAVKNWEEQQPSGRASSDATDAEMRVQKTDSRTQSGWRPWSHRLTYC